MTLIDRALKMPSPPVCIMMTAYGSVDTAVEAMKRGAYDFVTKPVNLDSLEIKIRRALRGREVESENQELRQQVEKKSGKGLAELIGRSAVMENIFDTIRQVAPTRATVLIEGESGTGKELVARALHTLSNRKARGSSPSTARRSARNCWKANSSATSAGRSPGRPNAASAASSRRTAARFSSTRSARSTPARRRKSCACSASARSSAWAATRPITVDVRLVAATNRDLEAMVAGKANSARTFSTGSTSCASTCRPCATGPRTSR